MNKFQGEYTRLNQSNIESMRHHTKQRIEENDKYLRFHNLKIKRVQVLLHRGMISMLFKLLACAENAGKCNSFLNLHNYIQKLAQKGKSKEKNIIVNAIKTPEILLQNIA